MHGSGLWKKLSTPTILVLTEEAIPALQALTILRLTVTPLAQTEATSVSVSAFHFSRKGLTLEKNLKRREKYNDNEGYKKKDASYSE